MTQDIIIIGAPRCGTTSLFNWLGQHPSVCASVPKESRFFEAEYHNGPDFFYEKYFPDFSSRKHSIRLTARPQLSWVGFCAQRVKNVSPDAHIIMMVRNPIERAYSGWKLIHDMRPGREPMGFEEFILFNLESFNPGKFDREEDYILNLDPKGGCYYPNVLEAGLYHHNLLRYNELYDRKDITVIDFHEMIASEESSARLVNDILGTTGFKFNDKEFLQEAGWHRPKITEKMDAAAIKENYPMTHEKLRNLYAPDVLRLGSFMGRNLLTDWGMSKC